MKSALYSELSDVERRNALFDENYYASVSIIAKYLETLHDFDLTDKEFFVRVSETVETRYCRIEYRDYTVRGYRISYIDDDSFLLEGDGLSLVVHRNGRMRSPHVIWFDILRLRWLIQYSMRIKNGEPLPPAEVEDGVFARIFRDAESRREAAEMVAEMKRKAKNSV